jgi:hypothetical protein
VSYKWWSGGEVDQGKPLLRYADYNAFSNAQAMVKDNYAVTVEGKTERTSAGFGLNDLTPGGAVNEQVDPRFAGPLPAAAPYDLAAVKARTTGVKSILAEYRRLYTPAAGSPLTDAGDPADGAGNDIGAVGSGQPHPADLFGMP